MSATWGVAAAVFSCCPEVPHGPLEGEGLARIRGHPNRDIRSEEELAPSALPRSATPHRDRAGTRSQGIASRRTTDGSAAPCVAAICRPRDNDQRVRPRTARPVAGYRPLRSACPTVGHYAIPISGRRRMPNIRRQASVRTRASLCALSVSATGGVSNVKCDRRRCEGLDLTRTHAVRLAGS